MSYETGLTILLLVLMAAGLIAARVMTWRFDRAHPADGADGIPHDVADTDRERRTDVKRLYAGATADFESRRNLIVRMQGKPGLKRVWTPAGKARATAVSSSARTGVFVSLKSLRAGDRVRIVSTGGGKVVMAPLDEPAEAKNSGPS